MAGEQTPPLKVIPSGLEMDMGEDDDHPSSSKKSPVINVETLEVSGDKGVFSERLPDPSSKFDFTQVGGDKFSLPPGSGHGSSLSFGSASVGSLFSTSSPSLSPIVSLFSTNQSTTSPIITFSSSPGQVTTQNNVVHSLRSTSRFANLHGNMGGPSMVVGQSSSQSMTGASQSVNIQESHLLELIKLASQATKPTPPPSNDWFSQLSAALRPTQHTPPPTPPPPTGVESIMKLLVDELKKQKQPEPTPEPVSPARELLKMLKVTPEQTLTDLVL